MICAISATYRRGKELERLLQCLKAQTRRVDLVAIADNAADPSIQALVEKYWPGAVYLPLPANDGCGAGLRACEEALLKRFGEKISHFWVLDDDAVPPRETLEKLLQALEETGSGMAVPLCRTPEGKLWSMPEPRVPSLRREIRKWTTPEQVEAAFSGNIHPLIWSCGVCQLVTRNAAVGAGLHRTDYWMLGEDTDFAVRVSRAFGGVFRTDLVVDHLPPPASPGGGDLPHWRKFVALLQNLTYIAFHVRGSSPMWRYLPGNYRRFVRTFGCKAETLRAAFAAFLNGALFAEPAGGPRGTRLRNQAPKFRP